MAIGAAIFSGIMAVESAKQQRKAGRKAQAAAEEGALGIEAETEMNIEQTRRSQAQTLGLAKANIAASGIRFDASKIGEVTFTEGGTETRSVKTGVDVEQGYDGDDPYSRTVDRYEDVELELEGGEQIGGATEGSSIFNYLKEMKREFSKDIAWQGKEGRSRARVARMGGQVAKATAYAGAAGSYANAASSFASAYGSR